jgi:hypothetical protein
MLMCCVCAFSLHRESPVMILGDEPLISEVVLSDNSAFIMLYLYHEMEVDYLVVDELINIKIV